MASEAVSFAHSRRHSLVPPVVDGTGDSATACTATGMPLQFGSVTSPHYGGQGCVPGSGMHMCFLLLCMREPT